MPRPPRIDHAHVTQLLVRTTADPELPAFVHRDDYRCALDSIQFLSQLHGIDLHAWCLLPTALALLVTPRREGSVSRLMQGQSRAVTLHVKARRNLTAPMWSPRFRSCLVSGGYHALATIRYVETGAFQPQRLALPHRHPWSSAAAHCGLTAQRALHRTHPSYLALAPDAATRAEVYGRFLRVGCGAAERGKVDEALRRCGVIGEVQSRAVRSERLYAAAAPVVRRIEERLQLIAGECGLRQ